MAKRINFFITSCYFPSVSLTGKQCSLRCKHCRGKLLEPLIPAITCEELVKKALLLYNKGAKGILLTGGCDEHGCVPIKRFFPAIREIKNKTELIVVAHTGFVSSEEVAMLENSGLDGIGFDVVGDPATAREVYGLDVSENEYMQSLYAMNDSNMMVFPHVCVGLHFGKLRGEFKALEMIEHITPSSIIITGLMPVSGTPMENIKPKPSDFVKVIAKAVRIFKGIPVVLGCAHSSGKEREVIERIALEHGIKGIASPTLRTIKLAKEKGYEISYYGICCGLVPDENSKVMIDI